QSAETKERPAPRRWIAATKCQPNIRRSSFRRFMRYGWQLTSNLSLKFANKIEPGWRGSGQSGLLHQLQRQDTSALCTRFSTRASALVWSKNSSTNEFNQLPRLK